MRGIALETSGLRGSVAAFDGEHILAAQELTSKQRSAQSLAPALRDLLTAQGWQPRDVQLVAVTAGPGSFTGLRIGVTTAKTFAYAVGAELVAVDTLEVIASQAPGEYRRLHVILDAGRSQAFAAQFSRGIAAASTTVVPSHIVDMAAWLAALQPGDTVTGPLLDKLGSPLPPGVAPIDSAHRAPTAAAVARVAWQKYLAGQRDDPIQLVPLYLRLSAAEEKQAMQHRA
ncbi:MAG: tRNA (adenosine(37)-N6)-threonylcarbamoyltransferase complex dimerization subunit type 1 TsaB [Pirellulales bacterium]|nr:tRNA (adenosine(37)-N6)-threonylcarbamoyltransferase complex dimerization subunit type 1 TsaB [Pirellulales bacterium]